MRVLCIGNNTEHTDQLTRSLASETDATYHYLLSEIDNIPIEYSKEGYYHTSVFDISYGALIELGKQFDQIVILDQTVESYGHPDSYYKTIRLGKELEQFVAVIWQQKEMSLGVDFFEELVNTNKSFCIFPFIELLTNNDYTTVCCRSTNPITKVSDIVDYSTDPEYQKIRTKMLAGEKVPEHCSRCYELEDIGIRSARQQETVEWANRLNLKSLNELASIKHPIYYEVRPGNKCNLQCRMCGPESSELIDKEYVALGLIQEPVKIKYSGFDIVDLDYVRKLYVAGGEPTAMPEFFEFIDKCILQNNKFEFTINTNAVKFSDKFKTQLKKLPHVQFIVSIDGYSELNDYIRWPSKWANIIDNVKYLQQEGHVISFNTTVSLYNVADLYSLLSYFDIEFPGVLVHCQLADGISNPLIFPDTNIALEDISKIQTLNCYRNDPLLSSFVDNLIKYYNRAATLNTVALNNFKKFNQLLDKNRGVDLKNYSPKLWDLLERT